MAKTLTLIRDTNEHEHREISDEDHDTLTGITNISIDGVIFHQFDCSDDRVWFEQSTPIVFPFEIIK